MNSIQDKIATIKQSIEDKGYSCYVGFEGQATVFDISNSKGYIASEEISNIFLELLPLSLPNKEGWISVEKEKPKVDGLYLVVTACDSGVCIREFCTATGYFTNYDGYKVTYWQPLPPAPVKIKE